MNTDEILSLLNSALKTFGTYQFEDKGPHEVMDVSIIVDSLRNKNIEDVIKILEDVIKKNKKYGNSLVYAILGELQDLDDISWNSLMDSSVLDKCFNS